jgi:tetratricopeptide (TPR) repeat protein
MQQVQPSAPGAAPVQRQAYPGWPGAYRQPQQPAAAATTPALGPEASSQQEYQQVINKARHAYWQGQYQQSVSLYEQAIKLMPETPDGYGELGNVHYAQGEWDKAGESLYQAAIRLLDKGRTDKANNLLSIIRGLQHERAAELEKRLQAQ